MQKHELTDAKLTIGDTTIDIASMVKDVPDGADVTAVQMKLTSRDGLGVVTITYDLPKPREGEAFRGWTSGASLFGRTLTPADVATLG